jgi:nucleoside-diphosphate-sugar epimerase
VIVETADLFDEPVDWWRRQLEGIDAIIHAAWYVEPGKYLDSPLNLHCVEGSLRMASAASEMEVRHFVGIGTCFEYRLPNDAITTHSPLGPVTLYAAAKLALMRMLEARFSGSKTAFTWARLFYLFGEGENPARLYPTLHRKLSAGEPMQLSSGDKLRDFLDVKLAGKMIAELVDSLPPGVVNICSGKAVTLRAIAEEIADIYGRRDLLSFGNAPVHPRDPQAVVGVPSVPFPK